jgi:hypothetical protein
MWWFMPEMPAFPEFGRLRQEDCKFKASLGYKVRPYLKNKKKFTF